jgi:hypothetical protein
MWSVYENLSLQQRRLGWIVWSFGAFNSSSKCSSSAHWLKNPVKPKSGKNNDREESEFQLLGKLKNTARTSKAPPSAA